MSLVPRLFWPLPRRQDRFRILAMMACSWAFARHAKLLDAVCSIPALSAAARQAGQASTSQIQLCSTRLLSLPLTGLQGRQIASSAALLPLGIQTNTSGGLAQPSQPSPSAECRSFHSHAGPDSMFQGSLGCLRISERSERKRLLDCTQRRTAFGLPNLNGDPSKKYHERRLIG